MQASIAVYLLLLLPVKFASVQGGVLSTEARLVQDLLANYVKYSKPTINAADTVHLVFGAELVQIVSIMMPNQVLSTKLWVRMKWKNELLAWNASDYDGITSVRLNAIDVWTPDIQLYQEFDPSANSKNKDGLLFKTQVAVQSDGTTIWNSPATFSTSCELHLADFPYDAQTCQLKFGPWNSDVASLNMTGDNLPMTTDKFVESSEWELLSVDKRRNSNKYACCDHPFTDVTVTIRVRRKPLFYWFNFVVPYALLLIALWVGYFVPAQSGERVSLSLVILLAFSIFIQTTSAFLPRSSELPSLSILYFIVMIEVAISALVTCVIVTVHYTSELGDKAPMPLWVEKYLLINGENFLRKVKLLSKDRTLRAFKGKLQMQPMSSVLDSNFKSFELERTISSPVSKRGQDTINQGNDNRPTTSVAGTPVLCQNSKGHRWKLSVERSEDSSEDNFCSSHLEMAGDHDQYPSSLPQLDGILQQLKIITNRWRSDAASWEAGFQWCRLAVVLDRFMFIVLSFFSISTLISFTIIRPAIATS